MNKEDLPYRMGADPNPFDTVENLERHLASMQARPNYENKASDIARLKDAIAIRKRHSGG
jgi:hypothetical protein